MVSVDHKLEFVKEDILLREYFDLVMVEEKSEMNVSIANVRAKSVIEENERALDKSIRLVPWN